MKDVDDYLKVRHAVRIEGLSLRYRAAAVEIGLGIQEPHRFLVQSSKSSHGEPLSVGAGQLQPSQQGTPLLFLSVDICGVFLRSAD